MSGELFDDFGVLVRFKGKASELAADEFAPIRHGHLAN